MSNLGLKWEDDEHYSPRRMDAKNILRDTGANIVALATTRQLGMVIPTASGGGLVKNVCYIVDYDTEFNRIDFIPIFVKHLHNTDTNEAGGSLFDIQHANSGNVVIIELAVSDTSVWTETKVGAGDLTDVTPTQDESYLQFQTGIVTNDLITGNLRGIKLSFAQQLMFQLNAQMSHNSNLIARIGINIDRIEDSQDTARRQMGIEGCNGHGTNWVIINANGNTSSLTTTPTSAVLNEAAETNYKLVHIPATECRLYRNGVSVGVSNTNVASSGESLHARLFKVGLKLSSGVTEKTIKMWQGQIIGAPSTGQRY